MSITTVQSNTLQADAETLAKVPAIIQKAVARYSRSVAVAETTVIETQADADMVANNIRDLKARKEEIEGSKSFLLEPLKQAAARLTVFFSPALEAIGAADRIYRAKLLAWNDAETARVRRERAEAEARERKVREDAEAAAREARRVAQAEADRIAAEAREAQRRVEAAAATGDAAQVAAAQEKVVALHEKAAAVIETAEVAAATVEMTASASIHTFVAPAKAAGTGGRDNHNAEVVDDEATTVKLIVAAIAAGRVDLLGLLALDASAVRARAKADKQNFNVPGLRYVNNRSSIVRSAK